MNLRRNLHLTLMIRLLLRYHIGFYLVVNVEGEVILRAEIHQLILEEGESECSWTRKSGYNRTW